MRSARIIGLICAVISASSLASNPNQFVVFDAAVFSNKPDTTKYGLKPIRLLEAGWTFPNGPSKLPDETSFKNVMRKAQAADAKTPIVFDIEQWPTGCRAGTPPYTPEKFETLVRWTREAAPKLKIGFYGVVPITNYWDAQLPETDPRYIAWQKNNDCYRSLANQVDYIFPSLYTSYPAPEFTKGWIRFATQNIQEVRRLSSKPVYPFIWMQYHDSTGLTRI